MRKYRTPFKLKVKNALYSIKMFFARPFIRHKNKKLIERYPFLRARNYYDYVDAPSDYDFTFLDCMPETWKKDFGIQMCEEIRDELIRCSTPDHNWLEEYSLCQVKEKYGTLRWYDNGTPIGSKIDDIVSKYEDRSGMVCICCGKPAKYVTPGWIAYVCEKCFDKKYKGIKDIDFNELKRRQKLYRNNIPVRTLYAPDGTETDIPSPYLEEMKQLWPDEEPEDLKKSRG